MNELKHANRREQLAYVVGLVEHGQNDKALDFMNRIGIIPRMHEGADFYRYREEWKVAEWIMGQIVDVCCNEDAALINYISLNAGINIVRSFLNYDYWYSN